MTPAVAVAERSLEVRDAEIAEARHARVVEEHVRRLDVAMEDAETMRLAERREHGVGDLDGARGRERRCDHRLERPAAHPREHDRRALRDVVAQRHDVRVIERAEHAHLALEAREGVAAGAARVVSREDLHGDALAANRVDALEHARVGVDATSRTTS